MLFSSNLSRLCRVVLQLRGPCMHDFDTRHRVAQLFLVMLSRMRVVSSLMSQHLFSLCGPPIVLIFAERGT